MPAILHCAVLAFIASNGLTYVDGGWGKKKSKERNPTTERLTWIVNLEITCTKSDIIKYCTALVLGPKYILTYQGCMIEPENPNGPHVSVKVGSSIEVNTATKRNIGWHLVLAELTQPMYDILQPPTFPAKNAKLPAEGTVASRDGGGNLIKQNFKLKRCSKLKKSKWNHINKNNGYNSTKELLCTKKGYHKTPTGTEIASPFYTYNEEDNTHTVHGMYIEYLPTINRDIYLDMSYFHDEITEALNVVQVEK